MGSDQKRESSINMISHFTICVKREICEWQFFLFFVILSEILVSFSMSLRVIAVFCEWGMNGISLSKTEVKSDFVKC